MSQGSFRFDYGQKQTNVIWTNRGLIIHEEIFNIETERNNKIVNVIYRKVETRKCIFAIELATWSNKSHQFL